MPRGTLSRYGVLHFLKEMLPDLKLVMRLQEVDNRIAELMREIAALPKHIAEIEKKLVAHERKLEADRAALAANQKDRRKLEGDVQVFVGSSEEIARKDELIRGILDSEKEVIYINVRVPERPTFRGLDQPE